ncbi:S5A-REDUCTASE domain-containing protein [Mycena sanguinolenta]|uniref:S5A-REDUCTASE domain-containing protein n=1 Tax=Mycena sanguinolenta TaxID=230812 RepID=A0A8H6Z1A6_9AGAR|nr:S5A-REDUCTASE domain-containing protein [Mycena sanguinolenta]
MGPVQPHQPAAPAAPQEENPRPVVPPAAAPVRATPLFIPGDGAPLTSFASPQVPPVNPVQQTPFAGGAFPPQQQEPPVVPQFVQPPAQPQERANADIARVLQPLPTPNAAVYGPPPLPDPLPPLRNPLPTPPRDLYELSPYNTLLNLPQTTALLTAAYSQQGGLPPPPSYGRRSGNRTGGGLLRALTGRGRKEEEVRFVPVFINGQPPPSVNPAGVPAPAPATASAAPAAFDRAAVPPTPIALYDPPVPHAPTPRAGSDGRRSTAPNMRPPIRFSSDTPEYHGFLTYSPHRVMYNDVIYPTAMHLHEALKYLPINPELAEHIRACPDAGEIQALSSQLQRQFPNSVRPDWSDVYLQSMEQVILLKFQQHANLRGLLLNTLDAPLIYGEPDTYWGEAGFNHLGHILEHVRTSLQRELQGRSS